MSQAVSEEVMTVVRVISKARQARLAYGARIGEVVSLSKVAEDTGIDRMTLTRLETGKAVRADFDTLARLCQYYGVRIEDLLEYTEDIAGGDYAPFLAGSPA